MIEFKEQINEIMKHGSPIYVYDRSILKDRCKEMAKFRNNLEDKLNNVKVTMHYSPKANSNPAILKEVKDAGLCVDCMSPLELNLNKKSGFNNEEIVYVCNNIDKEEMKMVHDEGILICLDSISQVETWGQIFPNSNIMVRLNPGIEGVGHSEDVITAGKVTKFGITEANLDELFRVIEKYNLNIIGTHQHLGSLFLNDKIDDFVMGVKAGLDIIRKRFKNVSIVDLGGGFGVPYEPGENNLDLDLLVKKLEPVLIDFAENYPTLKEFKFEPGRFIPCESGYLIGRVNAIKHENDIWWIGTDLGMNQLVRPSMYDSYHEITVLSDEGKEEIIANICGNVCEGGDIIAKKRRVILPKVGDIVIVHNAGAYGYSMASNYTGRQRPAELLIDNGEIKLIRKRETLEYLEENIIWE